jgi:hypothetical protein
MSQQTKPRVFVGKFSGLKLPVFGKTQVIKCRLEIELRSSRREPDWFFVMWKFNGLPVRELPLPLNDAMNFTAAMFVEQIEPWQEVGSVQP